eukprot:TRINITY_DN548_c0_g1_i3.p1 TRINITY_DN548_c0_g1~~TRINITY_DN548_c0_g1_i3.p1  ORF type:complete len:252 (-),score=36.33 TRINITY_DN548_c0_g1_i3:27-782(-)
MFRTLLLLSFLFFYSIDSNLFSPDVPTLAPTQPVPTQQPAFQPIFPVYPDVKHVHTVFMTHLDIGYTNFAKNICDTYFFEHFPAAIKTAQELRDLGREERFVYTTHPWLLLEFFDGAVGCTDRQRTPEEIKEMEDAIMRGDVTWHAIPFSLFAEVSEANLFAYGLTLGHRLDQRFNKTRKIAGSHKDVPGISKAVLPLLANEGIKSIHIGCNTFVACPATPEIFLWDDQKGHEVLTMVHAGFPIYLSLIHI